MGTESRPRIRAIFLDLDDTLINMKRASHIAFNAALTRHGLQPVSYREMLANWDVNWRVTVTKQAPDHSDVERLLAAIGKEYFETFFAIHVQYSTLMPDAATTLHALRRMQLFTAIVSRRRQQVIQAQLDKFQLRSYVDLVVGREDVTQMKPAPDALLVAAERLAVPIDQCLMVGDSPNDIQAGKAAGAKTAAVLTGPYTRATIDAEYPDIVLATIGDLATVLATAFECVPSSDRQA